MFITDHKETRQAKKNALKLAAVNIGSMIVMGTFPNFLTMGLHIGAEFLTLGAFIRAENVARKRSDRGFFGSYTGEQGIKSVTVQARYNSEIPDCPTPYNALPYDAPTKEQFYMVTIQNRFLSYEDLLAGRFEFQPHVTKAAKFPASGVKMLQDKFTAAMPVPVKMETVA